MAARADDDLNTSLLFDQRKTFLVPVTDPAPDMSDREFFVEGTEVGGLTIVSIGPVFLQSVLHASALDEAVPGSNLLTASPLAQGATPNQLAGRIDPIVLRQLRGLLAAQGSDDPPFETTNGLAPPHLCSVMVPTGDILVVIDISGKGPRGEVGFALEAVTPAHVPEFAEGTFVFH